MQEKIIQVLKDHDGYFSGEEISEQLKISRAAIWKYIQELRHIGYDIVAVPHLGYKLASSPDKLFSYEIQHNLHTKILGKKIEYHETCSSTMDLAFQKGVDGAPEGTVVFSDGQSKGRGRLGRAWFSPKGKGIYMSVILRPQLNPTQAAQLTLLTGVAVSQAVKNTSNISALIKWPNDILVHHKKLAGILTEISAEIDRVKFVIVGIGINVNAKLDQLVPGATSILAENKHPVSRVDLAKEILREIEKWYLLFQSSGFEPVAKKWKELSATLHKRVRIADPAGVIEGIAVDIDHDGGLLIRKDSGVIVKKMAGDVVVVK
ncbi:MAG: biotin--[acetyl-CoA-carboxylase] ligase [Candidatus Omnitrophota bacterium]